MYYTHINRNVIDSNRKNELNEPPIRVQKGKYGEVVYGYEVALPADSRVIYSGSGAILPCGARLVIISEEAPTIVH